MVNILTRKHLFLTSAEVVNTIAAPLRKFGIVHFTFMRNYSDGSQIYLSNSAKWIEDYYYLELYKTSTFEFEPDRYKNSFMLWEPFNESEVILHGKHYYNSDNGITVIRKYVNYCEFYFFSGDNYNTSLINFYINNLDILEAFINYFKDVAAPLLGKAEANKLIISRNKRHRLDLNNSGILTLQEKFLRNDFFEEVKFSQQYSTEANKQAKSSSIIRFSKRQWQCLQLLIEGKSAKQTASQLNLSTRTIEAYLEDLKKKMQCRNKAELISKVLFSYNEIERLYS